MLYNLKPLARLVSYVNDTIRYFEFSLQIKSSYMASCDLASVRSSHNHRGRHLQPSFHRAFTYLTDTCCQTPSSELRKSSAYAAAKVGKKPLHVPLLKMNEIAFDEILSQADFRTARVLCGIQKPVKCVTSFYFQWVPGFTDTFMPCFKKTHSQSHDERRSYL